MKYLHTDAEYAAFLAVPSVLKKGKDISGHENHKGRGYSSLTFAAPVTINGVTGNLAVVVVKTGKYKYRTHRILMPNGAVFEFVENEKAKSNGADVVVNKNDKGTAINLASTISISENAEKSTSNAQKDGRRNSLVDENGEMTYKHRGMTAGEMHKRIAQKTGARVWNEKETADFIRTLERLQIDDLGALRGVFSKKDDAARALWIQSNAMQKASAEERFT